MPLCPASVLSLFFVAVLEVEVFCGPNLSKQPLNFVLSRSLQAAPSPPPHPPRVRLHPPWQD